MDEYCNTFFFSFTVDIYPEMAARVPTIVDDIITFVLFIDNNIIIFIQQSI